jgi:general secretion pathway protein C
LNDNKNMTSVHLLAGKNKYWLPKAMAACLGAGAAASLVFFGVQLSTPLALPLTAAPVSLIGSPQNVSASVARALGVAVPSTLQVAPTDSQFKLLGLISSASGRGSALIATDGQWPKAYRVGQSVKDDLLLVSLSPTQAVLKSPSTQLLLDLPVVDKP